MPHRIIAHLSDLLFLAAATLPAWLAARVIAVGQAQNGEIYHTVIWDSSVLRAWCVIGSLLGAVLCLVFFPPTPRPSESAQTRLQRCAAKYVASLILGAVFTPSIFRIYHLQPDIDLVLMISTSLAFLAVAVLTLLLPRLPRIVEFFFRSKFPDDTDKRP